MSLLSLLSLRPLQLPFEIETEVVVDEPAGVGVVEHSHVEKAKTKFKDD